MSSFIIRSALSVVVNKLENILNRTVPFLWHTYSFPSKHGPVFDLVGIPASPFENQRNVLPAYQNEDTDYGILWAVPRNRRSVEKRMIRHMDYRRRHHPKNNLKICERCGHFYEFHAICGFCYEKVHKETEEMQKAIEEKLKLNPVEKEVVVIYKNDKRKKEDFSDKYPVEMPKERPPWFSPNLLSSVNPHRKVSATQIVAPEPKVIIKD